MIEYLEKNMAVGDGVDREALAGQLQVLIKLQVSQLNQSPARPNYEDTKAGVLRFAKNFAGGNRAMILASLPTPEETRMICATPEDAAMVDRYLEMFRSQLPESGIARVKKEEQTEIQVIASTTDLLKTGQDQSLPGGYSQTAARYRSGLNFYAFRYAKPGESLGMRYDVCVYVNGRLVFIPKIWRAFR
jgi:hypothetical protein